MQRMQDSRSLLCALAAGGAWAHGDEKHAKPNAAVKKEQKAWGIAGDAQGREADDRGQACSTTMRFSPDRIDVKQGETVRFVVTNNGKVMHEFVIGTKKELDEHAALMVKYPEHGARRAVHGACRAGQDRRDRLDLQPRRATSTSRA